MNSETVNEAELPDFQNAPVRSLYVGGNSKYVAIVNQYAAAVGKTPEEIVSWMDEMWRKGHLFEMCMAVDAGPPLAAFLPKWQAARRRGR